MKGLYKGIVNNDKPSGVGRLKLKLGIYYHPDGGDLVKFPSIGRPFLDETAEEVIRKYRLENGADFDDIRRLAEDKDMRNYGVTQYLHYVNVVIIRRKGSGFERKGKTYDFDINEIIDHGVVKFDM